MANYDAPPALQEAPSQPRVGRGTTESTVGLGSNMHCKMLRTVMPANGAHSPPEGRTQVTVTTPLLKGPFGQVAPPGSESRQSCAKHLSFS